MTSSCGLYVSLLAFSRFILHPNSLSTFIKLLSALKIICVLWLDVPLLSWLKQLTCVKIFKILTSVFFLGFLLDRSMLISSVTIFKFLFVILSDFAFYVLSMLLLIYKFLIIIFWGSCCSCITEEIQAFLFLLLSCTFIENKASQRSQLYVGSQFQLWALHKPNALGSACLRMHTVLVFVVNSYFSGIWGTPHFCVWVQMCIKKIIFYLLYSFLSWW